jgi:DMSO/TMAO reductase YedYZ heme-binding membrane subunit
MFDIINGIYLATLLSMPQMANQIMKNVLKKLGQKASATLMLLTISFAALATGSNGDTTIPSLSSQSGIEISGLVTFIILAIIVLASGPSKKLHNK